MYFRFLLLKRIMEIGIKNKIMKVMFMEKLYRRMILLVAGLGCLACSEQETPVYEGLDFVNLESKQVSLFIAGGRHFTYIQCEGNGVSG